MKDVDWHFKSAENRTLFQTNPERYAPQFSGYCATTVSTGLTIDTNPESWLVENDKLYLFFDDGAKNGFVEEIPNAIIEFAEKH